MIKELLKLASTNKECEEKLAFVYQAMEMPGEFTQEFNEDLQYLIEEIEEKLEKTALIGQIIDGGTLLIPSMIGSHFGAKKGKELYDKGEVPKSESIAKLMLIPGYMGYRAGMHDGIASKWSDDDRKHFMEKKKYVDENPEAKYKLIEELEQEMMDKGFKVPNLVPNMSREGGTWVKPGKPKEQEKTASFSGFAGSVLGGLAGLGTKAHAGIGAAAEKAAPYIGAAGLGAAGIVGTSLVNDMYSLARNAVTRNRNYEKMLNADPELKEYPAEKVKAYFNTLHEKGGPEMSGDPLIASAFVKQQLELPPQFLLEQVHKLVGTRANIDKSKSGGNIDLARIMSKMG